AEVVGIKDKKVILMPYEDIEGIRPGCDVIASGASLKIPVSDELLGRIIDGIGKPIDGKEAVYSSVEYPIYNTPPKPLERKRINKPLSTGIKAIDAMLTVGEGQRMGIFAGTGVGKSTLLGMIARHSNADVNVIGLVGERSREVRDFIEKDLGKEGLKRSVVVVATSDTSPLMRIKAAFLTTSIAEYFRDQGKNVVLMMDSVTRFARAQREIGLSVGEPPTTRGYTPSVYSMIPKLIERTGTSKSGSITSFYSVLVEGDDFSEPISDNVRGVLDGHINLSRNLASKGYYPAIDLLDSISRLAVDLVSPNYYQYTQKIKQVLAIYKDAEDLINIGAYVKGSNPKIDYSISMIDKVNDAFTQGINEYLPIEVTCRKIVELFSKDDQNVDFNIERDLPNYQPEKLTILMEEKIKV
ncbi:MAG: FliI/YscN family ATPase, partial [Spirochaetota bacterium]|nr:FliI/YscN family ATPase [Spirochaetota bacterium]